MATKKKDKDQNQGNENFSFLLQSIQIPAISGVSRVLVERNRQIKELGRTLEYDKEINNEQEMRKAASAILLQDKTLWPQNWNMKVFEKICGKTYQDRLVIAGALICAEIDRIQ